MVLQTRLDQHFKIVSDTLERFVAWKAQNCGEVVLFHAFASGAAQLIEPDDRRFQFAGVTPTTMRKTASGTNWADEVEDEAEDEDL